MRRITFFACMTVAAGGALVAVSPAPAQETCYKITDLGVLGFTPGSDIVFGVNNLDQAVFTAVVGTKKHAMLYLPAPAYDLAAGCHDLHLLANLDENAESAGYEINDVGMAVGWAEINGAQHALVWEINDYDPAFPPLPRIDLADFDILGAGAPTIQVPTVAWAINNADPPVVVGDATGLSNCACPPDESQFGTLLGFKAVLDGSDLLQRLLPIFNPPACDYESHGRDISSLAVGYSAGAAGGPCPTNGSCDTDRDAVSFPTSVPVALTDLSPGGSEARGVNDIASIVGWGFASGVPQCLRRALYWTDPADIDPTILETEPPAGADAWAEAINNLALPQVVGWNEDTNVALLWKCDGPDCDDPLNWSVTDLNDTIQPCSTSWVLFQAHDLTDAATPSIVGWGTRSGVRHGFLLTPDPLCCPADLDGSGAVGANDLLILLSTWGPCEDCGECGVECVADINCDCSVGAADLLILLTAWGPCGAPVGGPPQDILDCLNRFCCAEEDMLALEKCICLVDPECDPSP